MCGLGFNKRPAESLPTASQWGLVMGWCPLQEADFGIRQVLTARPSSLPFAARELVCSEQGPFTTVGEHFMVEYAE